MTASLYGAPPMIGSRRISSTEKDPEDWSTVVLPSSEDSSTELAEVIGELMSLRIDERVSDASVRRDLDRIIGRLLSLNGGVP